MSIGRSLVAGNGYRATVNSTGTIFTQGDNAFRDNINGKVNSMIAMSTRFTPTSILLMIAGRLNGRGGAAGIAANPGDPPSIGNETPPQEKPCAPAATSFERTDA
jgi:hypothetical protein